jgi:hypothetical protein
MRTIGLLLLCLALITVLALLFVETGGGDEGLEGAGSEPEVARLSDRQLPDNRRVVEPTSPESGAEEFGTSGSEREAVAVDSVVSIEPSSGPLTFVGSLVLPDRSKLRLPQVRAELRPEVGDAVVFDGVDVESIAFSGVRRERYELRVEAAGYTHRPRALDFSVDQPDSISLTERVTLWPEGWIPVVVRTYDGRPFRELAADIGWESKRLFVNAFELRVSSVLAVSGDSLPPIEPGLATWRPAPGWQAVELPGSIAGSLELHSAPPLWVGLWVHGRVHEGRVLKPGDTQIVFGVDLAALEAGMASVTCKVVDRDSRAPVTDVSATIKADISAHRRHDLSKQAADSEGTLHFKRVIPGRHELTILREGQIVQRRFELATGEALDLGEVEIGSGPGLPVRVVDDEGKPMRAWVELGPFEKGRHVEELYHPNLHRTTDSNGLYELPVPDRLSVLRVRPLFKKGTTRGNPPVSSRNYLIDPDQLPAELVVIALEPADLRVEPRTTWVEGQHVTYEDEHGLVIDMAPGESTGRLDVDLVPGDYTARRWDGSRQLGVLAVDVSAGQRVVPCP